MRHVGIGPAAIVLAGGASTRFGADKLAADLHGRPVLARALDAVSAVASPVVLVLGPDADVPAWAAEPGDALLVARDPEPFGGPLVGLQAGLVPLVSRMPPDGVVLLAGGDMPTLVPGVLELLAGAVDRDPAVAAATLEADPRQVLPLALRLRPAFDAVTAILAGGGKRSLRALISALPSVVVTEAAWRSLDPSAATLRDVDTPSDLV